VAVAGTATSSPNLLLHRLILAKAMMQAPCCCLRQTWVAGHPAGASQIWYSLDPGFRV